LERNLHPTVIVRGYTRALEDALKVAQGMAFPIDTANHQSMLNVVQSCIGTKYTSRFGTLMAVRALGGVVVVLLLRVVLRLVCFWGGGLRSLGVEEPGGLEVFELYQSIGFTVQSKRRHRHSATSLPLHTPALTDP